MAQNTRTAVEEVGPALARKTWRSLEPIHAMVYFAPEVYDRYTAAGLRGRRMGYFASRAAVLGPVPAEVVIATFYNFSPVLVKRAIPAAWELASPAAILDARLEAVDATLRRVLGPAVESPELRQAAELARRAAEAAAARPQGRPLFAAHAAMAWPDEPHLVLWHAQTLLREFRGDGHVAALLFEGVSGLEALALHAASGEIPLEFLRSSRGWTDAEWAEAVDGLRERGLLAAEDPLVLTETGRRLRQRIEDRTDWLAAPAYAALSVEECLRLRALGRPISRAMVDHGLLPDSTPEGAAPAH